MSETHDFRVRTVLGKTIKIESAETELELAASGGVRVVLQSMSKQPLTDSREICIRGTGYPSVEAARAEGERWRDAVIVGFARIGLGADFRERAPSGGMTVESLAELRSEHPEVQLYNDLPGVQIFPSEPPAQFIRLDAEGVAGKFGDEVIKVVTAAKEREIELMDVQRLSFDLYSASFFLSVADASVACRK